MTFQTPACSGVSSLGPLELSQSDPPTNTPWPQRLDSGALYHKGGSWSRDRAAIASPQGFHGATWLHLCFQERREQGVLGGRSAKSCGNVKKNCLLCRPVSRLILLDSRKGRRVTSSGRSTCCVLGCKFLLYRGFGYGAFSSWLWG